MTRMNENPHKSSAIPFRIVSKEPHQMINIRTKLATVAAALLLTAAAVPAFAQSNNGRGPVDPPKRGPQRVFASEFDVSPPLRMIPPKQGKPGDHVDVDFELPLHNRGAAPKSASKISAFSTTPRTSFLTMSAPTLNLSFEGIGGGMANSTPSVFSPPDDQGDVGPSHVWHWVNSYFAIFDKAGNKVYPTTTNPSTAAGNTIWSGFSNTTCANQNRGDPLVYYDQLSNRWLVSQFAFATNVLGSPTQPFYQCVAVSTSSDPTGSYYRYAFPSQDGATWIFNDYGKGAIWWDAFYMTVNQFNGNTWYGGGVYAYDRMAMVNGQATASYIYYNLGVNYGGLLPTDIDGAYPPPPGTPEIMWSFDNTSTGCGAAAAAGCLQMWRFKPDWTTPANSEFKGVLTGTGGVGAPLILPTQPITVPCAAFTRTQCLPQATTTNKLEALGDRLLQRVSYRNFMDDPTNPHESIVIQHGNDPGVANNESAIRWYEIRDPRNNPVIYQQGNIAPLDNAARFGGAIAIDRFGNIGLLYHKTSATQVPEIVYTGRTPTDPLNQMQAEQSVPTLTRTAWVGTGYSQTGRWGDYFNINADPVNDCVFWGFGMYASAAAKWNERIFSFTMPGCTSCTAPAVPTGVAVTTIDPSTNRVTWNAVSGAKYYVYRSDAACPNGTFRRLTTAPVTATAYDDTAVVPGTPYFYQVSSVDSATGICESMRSGSDSATCVAPTVTTQSCTPPPVPTISASGNVVSWGNVAAATGGYRIYRANGACPGNTYVQVGTAVPGATSFTDNTVTGGATYSYKVVSLGATGPCPSAMSSCVTTTAPTCTIPAVPNGLAVTAPTSNTLHLAWTGTAAKYNVYRATGTCASPGTFTSIATGVVSTTFDDIGVPGGTSYVYKVSGTDATGACESTQSSCATGTASGGPLNYSAGAFVAGRPADTTSAGSAIRWIYSTGASAMSPPGIGSVYAVSNDRMLHSMWPASGVWPTSGATWLPFSMNAPAQSRPGVPTVLIGAVNPTAKKVVLLGSQDGKVYCIDALTGAELWSAATMNGAMVQAAANGMFSNYGGTYNLVFAYTRHPSADNAVYAFNASTGATAWPTPFDNGGGANGIGIINSAGWVSYSDNRIYFASRKKTGGTQQGTVWCVNIGATSGTLCPGYPIAAGDIDGSPTLFNGKLFVGTNDGRVLAFNATTGAQLWSYTTGDGPVKGFVTPDWSNTTTDIYFSTTSKVWALTDLGSSATPRWSLSSNAPSIPSFTGTALYFGSGDGSLYQLTSLNGASPVSKSVQLGGGTAAIGSPSIDFANSRVYVGTDAGQIYATALPLP